VQSKTCKLFLVSSWGATAFLRVTQKLSVFASYNKTSRWYFELKFTDIFWKHHRFIVTFKKY